jgi:hypothetical protein
VFVVLGAMISSSIEKDGRRAEVAASDREREGAGAGGDRRGGLKSAARLKRVEQKAKALALLPEFDPVL